MCIFEIKILLVALFANILSQYIGYIFVLLMVSFALKKAFKFNYVPIALISHASKVMLKILQARLQQCINCELPDVQAGFRKGRGTRDQITNIFWVIEKAREFQKNKQTNIYFSFIEYAKAFGCVDHNKLENSERDGNTRSSDLPLEKPICRLGSNC